MTNTISYLTVLLIFSISISRGQNSNWTLKQIDSVCYSVDNNKKLYEGISEGTTTNKKGKTIGGYETRDLKDDNTLYRLTYSISTDKTYTTTYYYHQGNIIKATSTIEIWDKDHLKMMHSAQYYFDKNSLIVANGETKEFLTSNQILEQGQKFQSDFYSDKK